MGRCFKTKVRVTWRKRRLITPGCKTDSGNPPDLALQEILGWVPAPATSENGLSIDNACSLNVNPGFCWQVFKHVGCHVHCYFSINPPPFCYLDHVASTSIEVFWRPWTANVTFCRGSFLQSQRQTFFKHLWVNYYTSKEILQKKLGKNTCSNGINDQCQLAAIRKFILKNLIHTKQPSKTKLHFGTQKN